MKRSFVITGMSCAACSARVEKAVSALAGVENVSVNLLTNSMTLESAALSDEEIIKAVKNAGYGAYVKGAPAQKAAAPGTEDSYSADIKRRRRALIWSFILLVPLMYVSMGHMLGLPLPNAASPLHNPSNFALLQLLLCIPIVIINIGYYTRGFGALLRRSPNMDSLIALGSAASLVYGIFMLFKMNMLTSAGDKAAAAELAHNLYFESSVMILTLINLGKYMEALSKGRTTDALKKLNSLAPQSALRETDGSVSEIDASEIRTGDILHVRPGSRVPADGVIIEGGGALDESMLTGESMPVYKTEGAIVNTATVNTDGFFRMRVTAAGSETSFSRIVRMVEEASASKPPISRLADRISGIFVPIVIGISLAVLIIWLALGADFSTALTRAISVLVVSCPCALGLATPVAVMVGTGRSAENGILIRGGEALEYSGKINTLVTDKTGTLTQGEPVVTGVIPLGASERELLELTASAESRSEHPLAKAVMRCAEGSRLSYTAPTEFENVAGRGIRAQVSGKTVLCGKPEFLQETGVNTAAARDHLAAIAEKGETPLLTAADGRLAGILACADTLRPTSRAAVDAFREIGVETVMLTGDNELTARSIAQKANITHVISGVLPDGKAQEISRLKAEGRKVAMLGDGINDAPALRTADIGIAIGAGTDVAIESADIILMHSDPVDAVNAVRMSRAVIKNIKENLFWAFFYNVLMIPIAAGALSGVGINMSPMIAAAAMSLSSLFVVTNALRLRRFKPIAPGETALAAPEEYILSNDTEGHNIMIKLKIGGMMCQNCVKHVKKALEAFPGVSADVDLAKGEASVNAPDTVSREELIKAVTDAGYEAE